MRPCHPPSLYRTRWAARNPRASRFTALGLICSVGLLATSVAAKNPPAGAAQEKDKKVHALRWDPPRVDVLPRSLSAAPSCALPDVLKQAGQRAEELVDHLQNFIAHEQVRYEQTDSPVMLGMSIATGTQQIANELTEISISAKFDYLVDFGEKSESLKVHETRTPLAGTDDEHLGAILDKGLPVLALIFHPTLQGDYDMRCEGYTQWNNQPAWLVHFRQIKGKLPRTVTMETPLGVQPLSLKGRAWIAAGSGQVLHLETNLVEGIPAIELQESAFSVDYGPVKFQSQDVELWLPKFAVAYTDYAKRRMITEHTFSDFQLFSVQTQQVIQRPKEPPGDPGANRETEGLNTPSKHSASEPLNPDSGERKTVATPARPAPAPRDSRWLPPDVDEGVPPVEPGSSCNLEEVLREAGVRIQEFVANVERFTATESLLQETINRSGKISGTEKRKYDYLVSIQEIRPGIPDVREYLSSGSTPVDSPGGFTTKGLPALVLIFHPSYSGTFSMKCEGLANWNGQRAWQIYFRQRSDKPNRIRAYSIGVNGPSHPVALKGRAWFVADTYQIVGLEADLIDTLPDIQLTADHTTIRYGPVHFSSRGVDMWLPQTAELYSDFRGRRIHQRMSYSDYLLFAVDDNQGISSPETSP